MKIYLFWLLSVLFTFLLGVSLTVFWFTYADDEKLSTDELFKNLPVLTYCELLDNPDKYDGKIIRLKTTIFEGGNHGGYISGGRKCRADGKIMDSWEATSALLYIDRVVEKKVSDIRSQRTNRAWVDPLTFIGVGKFSKNTPDKDSGSIIDNAPYCFAIITIDSIIDDSVPYSEIKTDQSKPIFVE